MAQWLYLCDGVMNAFTLDETWHNHILRATSSDGNVTNPAQSRENAHEERRPVVTEGFAAQLAKDLPAPDVRHVLGVFAADLDRFWDILSIATDPGLFARTAHALSGAAGAVGAVALEAACRAAMGTATIEALEAHRTLIGAEVTQTRIACTAFLARQS